MIDSFTQSPIERFGILYNIKNSTDVMMFEVTDPSLTSQNIDGLEKGTFYEVTISSVNSVGPSPASNVIEMRTDIDRKLFTCYYCMEAYMCTCIMGHQLEYGP